MKILSRKHLVEMRSKEISDYVEKLDRQLEKKGWYEKSKKGELTEDEQKLFDRIMDDFRWIRINAD